MIPIATIRQHKEAMPVTVATISKKIKRMGATIGLFLSGLQVRFGLTRTITSLKDLY